MEKVIYKLLIIDTQHTPEDTLIAIQAVLKERLVMLNCIDRFNSPLNSS